MRYVSTRGRAPELGFADVLLAGLAPDGGLYVPTEYPALPDLTAVADYAAAASAVMAPFVGDELGIAPDLDEPARVVRVDDEQAELGVGL